MSDKDPVLTKMLEYLDHAKDLLIKDGSLQATVFAHLHDALIYLPISYQEHETPDVALDLISKVIAAYNVREYYVVSESYRLLDGEDERVQDCINVLHVGKENRIIGCIFNRITGSNDVFFGQTVEIKPLSVEGTINDLFNLKERAPRMTLREREHIRMMFPSQTEEEIANAPDYDIH